MEPMSLSRIMPTFLTVVLRNDDIQEFDSKWDEILSSMTKIPSDDMLEGLYTLRIRESEKLKTELELYNMEIHQKKAGPDYQRLKTMVKSCIEQNLRIKNFWSQKRKLWDKRRGQESGDKTACTKNSRRLLAVESQRAGQCSKGDNCSFRHDVNKRAKTTQPNPSPSSSTRQNEVLEAEAQVEGCLDCPARITSKELAPIHSVKVAPSRMLVLQVGEWMQIWGKSALMRISRLKNSPAKGFKQMVTKVQWLCWKLHDNWVAYFKTWRRRSLFSGSAQTCGNQSNVWNSQRLLHVTLKFETKIHRLEWFAQVILISVTPNAPKFEDRSQEETEWQERCAREAAWKLAKNILKLKEKL